MIVVFYDPIFVQIVDRNEKFREKHKQDQIMKDNFDKELRNKYVEKYDVDIENMNVKELLLKGKGEKSKNKLIYNSAALEKHIFLLKSNYNQIAKRRGDMQSLLTYFKEDITKNEHVVWEGYLLHVKDKVKLPKEFEEIIQKEFIKIATEYAGMNSESTSSYRKKKYDEYFQIVLRAESLLDVITLVIEKKSNLDTEYNTVGAEKGISSSLLKALYNAFVRYGEIRLPK